MIMAFKIELKSTVIPFSINGFDFEVDAADENLKAFNEKYIALLKVADQAKSNLLENEEGYREFVQDAMDELLGDGSFEKLYSETPSIIILFDALNQIVDNLVMSMLSRVESTSDLKETANGKASKLKLFGGKK